MLNIRWKVAGLGDYSPNIYTLSGGIIRYKKHGNAFLAGWIPVMTDRDCNEWNMLVEKANRRKVCVHCGIKNSKGTFSSSGKFYCDNTGILFGVSR